MYLNKTLPLKLIRLVTASEAISGCPRCGKPNLRRSQVRFYEKFRKAFSSSRPYRCIGCRLRVWGHVRPQEAATVDADAAVVAAWTQAGVTETLDLSALDRLS